LDFSIQIGVLRKRNRCQQAGPCVCDFEAGCQVPPQSVEDLTLNHEDIGDAQLTFLRSELNQVQTLLLSSEYICVIEPKGRTSLLVGADGRSDLSFHLQAKVLTQLDLPVVSRAGRPTIPLVAVEQGQREPEAGSEEVFAFFSAEGRIQSDVRPPRPNDNQLQGQRLLSHPKVSTTLSAFPFSSLGIVGVDHHIFLPLRVLLRRR
jgi:hypothetical protein